MWYEYLFSLISLYLIVAVVAGVHVLVHKRNSRAAFGWLGLIILFPIAGAVLYALFGINRVRRKALRVSQESEVSQKIPVQQARPATGAQLDRPGFCITDREARPGNEVTTYYNGEQAFPAMLDAIDAAREEVLLSSYIFDNDETGRRFIDRLQQASQRGVAVCVMVDDVGIRYSLPTIVRELKRAGLPFRRFMPLRLLPPSFSINLRTHRKILVTDRRVCFAGCMNIGDRHLLHGPSPHRASDLHFGDSGPVVGDFEDLFEDDWRFFGGDALEPRTGADTEHGSAHCRLVSDGPDETLDSMKLVFMGAISNARRRIWIMTPYFLPERQMMGCLQAAALSGVDIQVMIPQKNNWPLVQWALQHNMVELLTTGVKILQRPPPFAHNKCFLVDDDYVIVGSSNLDPRSLRLNFELGVEVFDPHLNGELASHFSEVAASCIPFTVERIESRSYPARIRDGAAALFTPYI